MKNNVLAALILGLGILIAGYFVGNSLVNAKKFDRTVRVKGLAEKEVQADVAIWPMEIQLAGNNLQDLQDNIKTQTNEVSAFFKDLGFTETELKVGSSNIRDTRVDAYGGNIHEFRFIAKTDVTIHTQNINLLQKALAVSTQLMAKGVLLNAKNSWRPVEYIFTELNEIKPAMIAEATQKAREAAEQFALDSKSSIGDIVKADQGLFSINDRDMNTPEIKKVRVVSSLEFQLVD